MQGMVAHLFFQASLQGPRTGALRDAGVERASPAARIGLASKIVKKTTVNTLVGVPVLQA